MASNGLLRQATPAAIPPPHADAQEREAAYADLMAMVGAVGENQRAQHQTLADILTSLQSALSLLIQANRDGVMRSVSLSASAETRVDTMGFQHSYILVAASQDVSITVPGVGTLASRTLNPDWNRLCYPSGFSISLASGSNVNALVWLTNDNINV